VERDATAVFAKHLTLVTPIDIDHEAFLGKDISSIALTKLNAIENVAIIAKQKYISIEKICKKLIQEKNIQIIPLNTLLNSQDTIKISSISKENLLSTYLEDNLSLAIAALNYLSISYEVHNFKNSRLFGRLSQFRDNILVDVGHNVLAARSIYESLNGSKYTLVYNSYKDKNYKEILNILKPILNDIEIIEIEGERVEELEILKSVIKEMNFDFKLFSQLQEDKNYLVFGSFSVVEAFLKGEYE